MGNCYLNATLKFKPKSHYPLLSIKEISKRITKGTTPTSLGFDFVEEGINFIKIENINSQGELSGELAHITPDCNEKLKRSQLQANDILFSIAGSFGRILMVSESILPANTNQALAIIRGLSDKLNSKYFVEVLRSEFVSPQIEKFAKGIAQYNISLQEVGKILIPLPPLDVQQKIVSEFEMAEAEELVCLNLQKSLESQLNNSAYFSFKAKRLGDIATMIKRGKSAKYGSSQIQIIKSGQARGYRDFDFAQRFYVSDAFVSDERNLIKGDILINSTGVGTAGRVTLFDLNGDFVVDSHITIVRVNNDVAIPKYILYALANIGFKTIESMANGQSGQIELALDTIKGINIPLPSIDKQKEIVAEIEKIETEIAIQKNRLSKLKSVKGEILAKYL